MICYEGFQTHTSVCSSTSVSADTGDSTGVFINNTVHNISMSAVLTVVIITMLLAPTEDDNGDGNDGDDSVDDVEVKMVIY